jgi:hypothetical protein
VARGRGTRLVDATFSLSLSLAVVWRCGFEVLNVGTYAGNRYFSVSTAISSQQCRRSDAYTHHPCTGHCIVAHESLRRVLKRDKCTVFVAKREDRARGTKSPTLLVVYTTQHYSPPDNFNMTA